MNMTQIKYVLEIAASPSMRVAATNLFVSQPALSASVKELEDELGILIFERSNRGIILTDAGREFVTYAKKAMNQYRVLEDRYLVKDKNKEYFSVSAQHYNIAIRSFTNVIRKYDPEKYIFSIHETKTNEVLENVRDMKSEVGVISYSESTENLIRKLLKEYQLKFMPLMVCETYAYMWEKNPLSTRKDISLKELRNLPCITFDQSGESKFYIHEEAMGDYEFDKLITSNDRATSIELMAELGGYSIGSGLLSQNDAVLQGMVSVKLKEEDPLTIGYIIRKGSVLSEYAKEYIEELKKYTKTSSGDEI